MTAFTVLLEGTPSDKPNNSGVELVHGIYPVSMEANFKPFSEFSDPDRQMRLMSLSDRAYKRAIPSLQKWSTGKQRVHFLANYMEEGPVDASATSNDLAQALRKTIDENRSLEEYIDYNVGLAQPGAFIFDAPIEIPNVVPMARSNNNSSSSVMLPELHVDFPTYGFKDSAHDDIVEFLIDFGSAVELLSLQKKGWYPYLATNCRGELKSFVMDANLLPHSTDWAAAERAICKYFVEDMYKAQLSVQLIEMKPQGGEIQRAYLHRVNKVYQKYVRVTGDDGGQLLFWVFHQRLSPSLRAHVDQNLPATDKLAFPALLKIACDTRASRNPIDESPANSVDAADAAGAAGAVQTKGKDRVIKWCGFHKSHSHSQGECKRRARGKSTTWCTYHSTANHDESDCNAAKAAGDSTTWCNYHSTSNHDESVCSAINKSAGSSSQNGNPVPRQR